MVQMLNVQSIYWHIYTSLNIIGLIRIYLIRGRHTLQNVKNENGTRLGLNLHWRNEIDKRIHQLQIVWCNYSSIHSNDA